MGKKCDLSNFERVMVPGARRAVRVFQKLLIYWDFHVQTSLGFTENGPKKEKLLSEWQFCGRKMPRDQRRWQDWFKLEKQR